MANDGRIPGDNTRRQRADLPALFATLEAMEAAHARLEGDYHGIFRTPFPDRLYVERERGLENALVSFKLHPRAYYTLRDRGATRPRAVALPARDLREFLAITGYAPELPEDTKRAQGMTDTLPGVYLRPEWLAAESDPSAPIVAH